MRLTHRLTRAALLAGWLGLLVPAAALAEAALSAFTIRDDAKMFSKEAREKAEEKIASIKTNYKKDVLVETIGSLPDDARKELDSAKDKKKFWREFAAKRFASRGVDGVYVLIAKNPNHLLVEPGSKTERKAFTAENRREAEQILVKNFKEDRFDKGLLDVVNYIDLTLNANVGKVHTSTAAPVTRGSTTTDSISNWRLGMFSGIGGLICLGLIAVLALWLIVGVFRALIGAGNRPVDRAPYGGGGYAPQGGYGGGGGGGGGGGFMSSMLGGMFGAGAGMFLYDSFFRGSSPSAGAGYPPSAYGGSTATPDVEDRQMSDTGGGTDWSSGGGEAGGGAADDAGGGTSWGSSGDDGGGGSFGGGDGGGGDWGGGGGGDAGGGGGGDW